jgi:acetolactate synthase-1/3 small subunit
MKPENTIRRQLALIKIHAPTEQDKSEIIQYTNIFRGKVADVTPKTITIEITGKPDKINALIELIKTYGIKEMTKTGITAITRGQKTL